MRRSSLLSILLILTGVTLVILAGYSPGQIDPQPPYMYAPNAVSFVVGLILIGIAVRLLRSGK